MKQAGSSSEFVEASGRLNICTVVTLRCMARYYLFTAVDGLALVSESVRAKVTGHTSYTQIIDGRPLIVPQTTPGTYLLKLDISGRETECAVRRDLYDTVSIYDSVQVTYQQRRLTGALRVVDASR